MIEIYYKTIRDEGFKRVSEVRAGCWLYVKNATLEDLQQIVDLTHLELNDIRDSLDKYEVPRIEQHGDNVIFFTRHPCEQEKGLYTNVLTLILSPSYLIAISYAANPLIESLLSQHIHLSTTQKSKLLLYILLRITQEFTASIKRVRHAILLHEEPQRIVDSDAIFVLTKNEEILNQYLGALVPMRNLLEVLSTERYVNLYEKDLDLLQDLMIAIHQSEDLGRVNVKSIRSLRDSYQIIFTNDVNRTIKRLTALTIIFSIPTMFASIYGMNVLIPLQKSPNAFFYVLGFAALTCLFAIVTFMKKRWL